MRDNGELGLVRISNHEIHYNHVTYMIMLQLLESLTVTKHNACCKPIFVSGCMLNVIMILGILMLHVQYCHNHNIIITYTEFHCIRRSIPMHQREMVMERNCALLLVGYILTISVLLGTTQAIG